MESGESLFSLELLVESARVEPRLLPAPSPSGGAFRPAVALRLLDFPTLVVRAPQAASLSSSPPQAPGPTLPFGRGKSCLFRLRPEALRGLLRRSPLLALLLALPPAQGPARLLGSCSVSLADAAEELLLLGSGPRGRRGHFPLLDLTGETVGELGLSYRLSNLGVCLMGHLGDGAAPGRPLRTEHRQEEQGPQRQAGPLGLGLASKGRLGLELIPEGDEEQDLSPEPLSLASRSSKESLTYGHRETPSYGHKEMPNNGHKEMPTYGCNEMPVYGRKEMPAYGRKEMPAYDHKEMPAYGCNEMPAYDHKEMPDYGRKEMPAYGCKEMPNYSHKESPSYSRKESPSYSHKEPPSNSPIDELLGEVDTDVEFEANIFCPPPMYYSCPPENPRPRPNSAASVIVAVSAAQESFSDEVVAVPPAVPLVKEEPTSCSQEVTSLSQTYGTPEQLRQTLSQLPLLNALLMELSLLNNPSLQPQPSSVHPQLAWLYQNAEGAKTAPSPCAKSVCPCCEEKKGTHRKDRGRSASPKLKRNRPDHSKCISPSFQHSPVVKGKASTKMVYAERIGSPEKSNAKENSPPRRKLTYGLTNTLKLRLQRSNPVMLKVHEKREHRRKKHGEVLVEKKGKTSAKGKPLHGSPLLHGSPEPHPKSSGHFDEKSIPDEKTQINENVETLIQSNVDQDCPTTKKSAAVVVKNSDDEKQKDSSEMNGSSYKEKSLKVHLPRVFLQDAETLENKIDMEVAKYVEHNDDDISMICNDSQSNHELKNSDDLLANSDNTAYSEDFTNADSTGPSLESQESSPGPLMENQDESHSAEDSDSKISGRNLSAECISPPLPVPSAASPVHFRKKTFDRKSNAEKTGVVFNKLADDSPPPGTLQEEVSDQHMMEERSKDIQTLENKGMCSDMNHNIAKCQSLEKSSSLRTSQVSSYLPSNVSDFDLSGLEESNSSEKEKEDDFAMLDITNQCRHISELVVNKLPGYTM
ncbi:microtubule-associated protein 10 [Sceloporus undulatus]|uniref:microtubule-associated protein 10 n=1 Tax=Sceloporus undulatus TaxID=8520 RepID=UPI001C4BE577|nr:microtubule-associated protein 10 [Sceloporus undulatus]